MSTKKNSFDLEERLVNYACMCLEICELLPETLAGESLGQQLMKSSRAAALCYGEAQSAGSAAGFIQKIKEVVKEIRESRLQLKLIRKMSWMKEQETESAFTESGELLAIYLKSISTARKNNKKTKEEKPA